MRLGWRVGSGVSFGGYKVREVSGDVLPKGNGGRGGSCGIVGGKGRSFGGRRGRWLENGPMVLGSGSKWEMLNSLGREHFF